MSFPADIKGAMRDCILKILWPKDDIVSFFKDNGCTSSDIRSLGNYKELSRAAIVDKMFSRLSAKPDGGLGPFRAMLHSLINWSHFDSYYFDKLRKLDRTVAQRAIEHLRQLQEIRDHKIKEERKRREAQSAEAQKATKTLEELKRQHIALIQGNVTCQERGYALESILQELAKLAQLEVTEPFRINGEQIDGAIKFEGEHYIIEAKWQDKAATNEPVYQFAGKVEGKLYGRGIFISVNGFSEEVVRSLVVGKAIKTIFVDGADIMLVLEGFLSFSELLDKKVKAAQTKGLIYIDAITGKSKISS
ncbi:restriction endonuclease [Desulfofundulus thermosubterraneus]|uniref:Restriction endonuclease n=1 Tax=Desulfofundulus thermosubterraneus DSM 16057 TaxID=1121432 RepID=A0A1M6MNJ3_9FIRM|nr:restriction endonuclease [Desulfofundulus thermosubterraneus]SHJ84940.1 Restriction endonuclease [Desulfofundulus thermosubterraneus DSM 16057]